MFSYAFARGFCERNGLELHTDSWLGERLFEIEHPRCTDELPRRDEFNITDSDAEISYRSYSQQQKCVDYYTRADCKRWFRPRADVSRHVAHLPKLTVAAHYRAGDFAPLGYVVVSKKSFDDAAVKFGIDPFKLMFVEEATKRTDPFFDDIGAPDAPDFFMLMLADVLFRSNSSYSWWAAVLSEARIFSPVIDGIAGGREVDCDFVDGNWPRLANFDFTTDLHLRER